MTVTDLATLTWRPAAPDDAALLQPLIATIGAHDGSAEHFTVDDVADELGASWLCLEDDTVVVQDASGAPLAYGIVQIRPGDVTLLRALCSGGVHPDARGLGIGRALLARQVARAHDLARARRAELGGDVPATVMIDVQETASDVARLATRLGLRPTRWFTIMRRPVGGDLPAVDLPDGLRLVPWSAARDDALRRVHNEAFADHWGFQPWSAETWAQWESGHRNFRPEWSHVALDGDEIAGYALSAAWEQDWESLGFREGWTNKLGVRRPWRGRGLAKALLAASMRSYAAAGMASAGLEVDTENLTGAVALYEGLGYRPAHRTATWSTDV